MTFAMVSGGAQPVGLLMVAFPDTVNDAAMSRLQPA
jgi:hypothetical protein